MNNEVKKEYWSEKNDKDFDEKEYDLKISDGIGLYF